MYRAAPIGNKLLHKRQQDKERKIHIRKLRSIKPTVDSRRPASYKHVRAKAKKD